MHSTQGEVSLEQIEREGTQYFEGTSIKNLAEVDKRYSHIIKKNRQLAKFSLDRTINNTYEVAKKGVPRAQSTIKIPKEMILQK